MADKPSRALVLYGDGLARFIDPSHDHLHLHASRASCGFLSLPHPRPESKNSRKVREFLHLLDACEDNASLDDIELQGRSPLPKLLDSELKVGSPFSFESNVDIAPSQLLKLLGFQEGKALTSQFDIVFVHVEAHEGEEGKSVDFVNGLIGGVMNLAQPGSEIGSRLHLSLVFSFGDVSENDDSVFSVSASNKTISGDFSYLIPRQSYTMKGGKPRENVRNHCPMLIAQWQDGVTRKDMVEAFSFKDFKEYGGNLTVPADRFIHEVAFKLWKAPKYGA